MLADAGINIVAGWSEVVGCFATMCQHALWMTAIIVQSHKIVYSVLASTMVTFMGPFLCSDVTEGLERLSIPASPIKLHERDSVTRWHYLVLGSWVEGHWPIAYHSYLNATEERRRRTLLPLNLPTLQPLQSPREPR